MSEADHPEEREPGAPPRHPVPDDRLDPTKRLRWVLPWTPRERRRREPWWHAEPPLPREALHPPVDLTHTLTTRFPIFPGDQPPRVHPSRTMAADGYQVERWELDEHTGTHLDAPRHFYPGGATVDQLAPEVLFVPLVVIDFQREAAEDADAALSVADVIDFERSHPRIPPHAAVLLHSGWHRRVRDPLLYTGVDAEGGLHFPGFSPEAAAWLVRERDVAGIGTDTLSLDPGRSTEFGAHHAVLGAGRWGLENVANLDRVPAHGRHLFIGVPPLAGATGAPVRLLAV